MAETSGSSRGRMRGSISTCVTAAPSRANACASSQPTGPPPRTTSRRGRSRNSHTLSEVSTRIVSMPGIGGTKGRAPAAITMARVLSVRAPLAVLISTVQGEEMRASP